MERPPHYSEELRVGERRMQHSPSRSSTRSQDSWLKTEGSITIALSDQEKDRSNPRYARRQHIVGAMLLDDRSVVASITIKIQGRQVLQTSNGGTKSLSIVDVTQVLWACDPQGSRICPGALPFDLTLPEQYKDEESRSFPIPPSFKAEYMDVLLEIHYILLVEVADRRRPTFGLISKDRTIKVPIDYLPRTRPSQPLLRDPAFLSSVKVAPEEWRQSLIVLNPKPNLDIHPINCSLFIPAVQTFAVRDKIPLHVQLSAPSASLRRFFLPPSVEGDPPSPTSHLMVNLVRQVNVVLNGRPITRNETIGTGRIRSLPPPMSSSPRNHDSEHMDWEGEVMCNSTVKGGGFTAAYASVKDYIILELYPPPQSPFSVSRNGIGVLIVTDPWTDEGSF